jgi:RNA polymerase sigma factor (sigma-70 family)
VCSRSGDTRTSKKLNEIAVLCGRSYSDTAFGPTLDILKEDRDGMNLLSRVDDLEDLVRRCQKRDSRAWSQLVDRFQNLVYSVPRRYGLNEDDAADVFQTTFQALLRNLDRIESARTLPKWLAVTASRESLRIKRTSAKAVGAEDRGLDLDALIDSEERSAEDNAILAERAELLRRHTQALNDRCRDLLTMLYLEEDPSYQEISEQLQMPIGAIGPTRARCLEKLRKSLQEEGFFG